MDISDASIDTSTSDTLYVDIILDLFLIIAPRSSRKLVDEYGHVKYNLFPESSETTASVVSYPVVFRTSIISPGENIGQLLTYMNFPLVKTSVFIVAANLELAKSMSIESQTTYIYVLSIDTTGVFFAKIPVEMTIYGHSSLFSFVRKVRLVAVEVSDIVTYRDLLDFPVIMLSVKSWFISNLEYVFVNPVV